jgi:hypothetical protein
MFIGYNLARRSGLPEKDFSLATGWVNPLRIRVLQSARWPSVAESQLGQVTENV